MKTNDTFPYVVLSDGDTYDAADGCALYFLTEKGQDRLANVDGMRHLADRYILDRIPLADLLDLWQRHGGAQ